MPTTQENMNIEAETELQPSQISANSTQHRVAKMLYNTRQMLSRVLSSSFIGKYSCECVFHINGTNTPFPIKETTRNRKHGKNENTIPAGISVAINICTPCQFQCCPENNKNALYPESKRKFKIFHVL